MKELEVNFDGIGEVKGMQFRQIQKSPKAFIYEVTDTETNDIHYEVFERRLQKEADIIMCGNVVHYEAKELYPKSTHFGNWAWCPTTHERAIEIFNGLNNKQEKL